MSGHRESGSGEVVVVTGSSAGVGRAVAREFGKRGARVGLLARGIDGLNAAAREIEELGGQAIAIPTDVADPDAVEAAAARVEQEFGGIDVWVNNAMTTIFAPFHKISVADYRRATDVTYLGTVYGTMAALKRMRPRNHGSIVQVGSALAYRAIPLQSPYCGAKHAIRGFTDSIRSELMHDGIDVRLSMVQLPAVNTPQFDWCKSLMPNQSQPVPPIYQPEVAAEAIVYAAYAGRREVIVGGSALTVIWGNKFLPGVETGIWRKPVIRVSRPISLLIQTRRTTCMSRSRAIMARMAASMRGPRNIALNAGCPGIGIGWPSGRPPAWPLSCWAGDNANPKQRRSRLRKIALRE